MLTRSVSETHQEIDSPNGTASRVSVVVPSYNHALFIERAIRSIIKQTHHPSELIVIDDGSTDNSPEIIAGVLKTCPFPCELIVRPNRGLCATLNEGLKRTRAGDYFAYLGSDDLWLREFLEARIVLLEARPNAVLAYGHAYTIDEKDSIIDCTLDWARYTDGDAREMLLWSGAPVSPTVVYRRSALERHGWNVEAKLEDYEIYLLLSIDGEFAFDPRVFAAWRRHKFNTSRDLTMMLDESLNSQRRVIGGLGITDEELSKIAAALKWRYAEDFMRRGQKQIAANLIYHNLRTAPSLTRLTRMIARLFLPQHLVRLRRNLSERRAQKNYGSIEV